MTETGTSAENATITVTAIDKSEPKDWAYQTHVVSEDADVYQRCELHVWHLKSGEWAAIAVGGWPVDEARGTTRQEAIEKCMKLLDAEFEAADEAAGMDD